MAFQSGFAGVFEGWTRLELIQKILRGLHQDIATAGTSTVSDYNRYPKQDIVDKLIEGQLEFVSLTDSLTTFAIVETVADQSEYRYPNEAIKILSAQYYNATTRYNELVIKANRKQMPRISSTWKTDGSGTPEYLYPSYNSGNIRKFGVYPKPASSGTAYTGDSLGLLISATDFTFTGDITGTHKTGFSNSAFLVDNAGRNMITLGVIVGMMIFNTTDGSNGVITAIGDQDATNDKVSVTLAGGTDDDFDTDDSFVITTGEYGVVIRADGTEELAFSSEFGALQDIKLLFGNLVLDFVKRPKMLDSDTQFPEIPMDYQQGLVEYAIWKLGGTEYDGFVAEKRSAQGEKEWLRYVERYNTLGEDVTEPDNLVEDREGRDYTGHPTNRYGQY